MASKDKLSLPNLKKKITSRSSILFLAGIIFIGIADNYFEWHNLFENIGLALVVSSISFFLYKFEIRDHIRNTRVEENIIDVSNGRDAFLNDERAIKSFLNKNSSKIDICGIAMWGLIEEKDLYDEIIDLAAHGVLIRIFFANPNSQELKIQEAIEEKVNVLTIHIGAIVDKFIIRINNHDLKEKVISNLSLFHSKTLPRVFIVRNKDKLLVTLYGHKGPSKSPTLLLKKGDQESLYNSYVKYLNNLEECSIKIDLLNGLGEKKAGT